MSTPARDLPVFDCDECPFSVLSMALRKSFICNHPSQDGKKALRVPYDHGKRTTPAECPLEAGPVLVALGERRP